MSEVTVKIHRLHPDAVLPSYAKPGDSGMDLRAMDDHTLYPGKPVKIDTGIALGLPEGYEAQVRPRSGLNARGIWCPLGTIDSGYRAAVGVILLNVTDDVFQVSKGDRVAQLVVQPIPRVTLAKVDTLEALGLTERGGSGFGSSGMR